AIISIALLVTIVGLFYQYRRHLAVPRVFHPSGTDIETTTKSSKAAARADWPPDTEPESVQEAWIAMVQYVDDVAEPSAGTPAGRPCTTCAADRPAQTATTRSATFCARPDANTDETASRPSPGRAAPNKRDEPQAATDG